MDVRRRYRVRGAVQGVGFRQFVLRTATSIGLAGWVRNAGENVLIEAQGRAELLDEFTQLLTSRAPRFARVDAVEVEEITTAQSAGFRIERTL